MRYSFESRLFAMAAEFTDSFAPYQGITLMPGPGGEGVIVASSDRGAASFFGYDPAGSIDEEVAVLPYAELARACKGIKNSSRSLNLEEGAEVVSVITHLKTKAGKVVEMLKPSAIEGNLPRLGEVISWFSGEWQKNGATSATAGRYDLTLLRKILATCGESESVVLSSFNGAGPMRVEFEGSGLLLVVMPQSAVPIPAPPAWLERWARAHA